LASKQAFDYAVQIGRGSVYLKRLIEQNRQKQEQLQVQKQILRLREG
jgi:hypothetical protein